MKAPCEYLIACKEQREMKAMVCKHLKTTIIDDRKYCVDCGEEVDNAR